jgi:lysophospholipase L1-like esterase
MDRATSRIGRAKQVLGRALLLLLGLGVACLGAEVVVRALDLPPRMLRPLDPGVYRLSANSILRFEYQPNHRPSGPPFEEGHEAFEINSWGFRDREFSAHKPGVTRIASLGDSVTAGLGVADVEDTYPKILERLLGGTGGRVEVFNLGVGGYDTEQEVEALRVNVDRLRPDVVSVGFSMNDFARVDGGIEDRVRDLDRDRPHTALEYIVAITHSRFLFFVLHRLAALGVGDENPRAPLSHADRRAEPSRNVARGLAGLSELQSRYGFRGIIFIIPAFDRPFSAYRHGAIHDRLQRLAAQHRNLVVVDLLKVLAPLDALAPRLSSDGLHPNESGHAAIASAICRSLVSLAWVSAPASGCTGS